MSHAAGGGVAGVRLADGRQVFVDGAPLDLEHGARVAVRSADQEREGTVSVTPRLIVWCDPDAALGTFLRIISSAPSNPQPAAKPPLALFLADEDAPDAARLNEMLNLAREELPRLDD